MPYEDITRLAARVLSGKFVHSARLVLELDQAQVRLSRDLMVARPGSKTWYHLCTLDGELKMARSRVQWGEVEVAV